jgi:hypothetical protein
LRRCRNRSAKEQTFIKAADIDSSVDMAPMLEGHGNQYATPLAQLEMCRF